MYGIETEDKATALASALSYWVFRCRDKGKSPAMGLKTWEYFQSSIQNAAIPSRNIDDYIENLAKKLIVAHLNPKEWTRIIAPKQVILRASVNDDGSMGDIQQIDSDQHLQWIGWQDILNSLKPEGIGDRHILNMCKAKPHVITTFCRVRFECDRALNIPEETENTLDVEANNA
tara:strand:- start:1081 stop:1602 length:522 start_codon:yes stop_codon:yes gene_type:complete